MTGRPAGKPESYQERRKWQDEQISTGRPAECGRMACRRTAAPAYVNRGTPLLYCARCAEEINRYNPGQCGPAGQVIGRPDNRLRLSRIGRAAWDVTGKPWPGSGWTPSKIKILTFPQDHNV